MGIWLENDSHFQRLVVRSGRGWETLGQSISSLKLRVGVRGFRQIDNITSDDVVNAFSAVYSSAGLILSYRFLLEIPDATI